MDETTLRGLFDRASATEPPVGPLARNALRAGIRLRRRRRLTSAATSAAAVAVLAGAVPAITGAIGSPASAGHRPVKPTGYVEAAPATIVPIDLTTNAKGQPIKLTAPGPMAIAPDGRTIYVASGSGDVTPISTATKMVGRPIHTGWTVKGFSSDQILITPNGKLAYLLAGFRGVGAINLAKRTELRFIKIPGATAMAITPDGTMVYVVGVAHNTWTVTPIRTATNTGLRPIRLSTGGRVGADIVIAPDGKTAYVTSIGRPGVVPNNFALRPAAITPIDLSSGTALPPIKLQPGAMSSPFNFEIAPDGTAAYTGGAYGVTPINLTTRRPLPVIKLARARSPFGFEVAITPDGRSGFAVEIGRRTVFPISLVTGRALRPIGLGAPRWHTEGIDLAGNGSAYVGRNYVGSGQVKNSGAITVIGVRTRTVIKTIFLPGPAGQIVFTP